MICHVGKAEKYLVYKVIWLRASARFNCWDEEVTLLQHKMEWMAAFFRNKRDKWEQIANDVGNARGGLACYAHKQRAVWEKFEVHARNILQHSIQWEVV